MLKAYSLDARIASIGSQLIDRVLENPHTCLAVSIQHANVTDSGGQTDGHRVMV